MDIYSSASLWLDRYYRLTPSLTGRLALELSFCGPCVLGIYIFKLKSLVFLFHYSILFVWKFFFIALLLISLFLTKININNFMIILLELALQKYNIGKEFSIKRLSSILANSYSEIRDLILCMKTNYSVLHQKYETRYTQKRWEGDGFESRPKPRHS